ncbi:MAG: UDP-N-acetylmuramoyl-L-alanyl-D-glutamate--2,6-diaminopimelate ligase, partial [Clostridiales bacterium]|nr:UDP-N-acetylmuramoyl-L-alanyl-D-glutamate--2,6-diaminopimelate ligase [Clostridiales bacterium]
MTESMWLSQIANELDVTFTGQDTWVTNVDYDSRRVKKGSLFCCIVGLVSDGHAFAKDAVKAGAVALVCERPLPLPVPQIIVPDSRKAMARAAACFYRHPQREMQLLGVTGTNGKTSVTYMVKAAAEQAGKKVGLIGTIGNLIGDTPVVSRHTTPESADLYALLRDMADAGVEIVVMEVSSHALAQDRVYGLLFDAALFTNLSQDHLDYHKTLEDYLLAKKQLFFQTKLAILNADDSHAEQLAEGLPCPIQRMGIYSGADYQANGIEITPEGVRFHLRMPGADSNIRLGIPGLFTVYNAMGAVALLRALDIPLRDIKAGLAGLSGVLGRLEAIPMGDKPYSVYVDYAHTPDALENVLQVSRGFTKGRLISLFGCGG